MWKSGKKYHSGRIVRAEREHDEWPTPLAAVRRLGKGEAEDPEIGEHVAVTGSYRQ